MMISFRLSEEIDQDILHEIRNIPKRDRSRTYREALRTHFFSERTEYPLHGNKIRLKLTEGDSRAIEVDLDKTLEDTLSNF
jgi:hypothetical protein